ncbi:MAG: hypothetical protein ABL869_06215, partial [Candidatus Nitrotoga sp.]
MPGSVPTMISFGQVSIGPSSSFTVTVNEQVTATLPDASVADSVTVVAPFWYVTAPLPVPSAMFVRSVGLPFALPLNAALHVPPGQF